MNKLQNAILIFLGFIIASFIAVYAYITINTAHINSLVPCNYPTQQTKLPILHDCY